LQDVQAGSGELIFYPGSHRFDHFLFSGRHKSFVPNRDGADQHKAFLAQLHAQAQRRGLAVERFLARKGDVLIWHADLAHGGARITVPGARRRSLVAHYMPQTVKPNYMDRLGPDYYEYKYDERSYFASSHYHMRDLETGDRARIAFDGDITANRGKALALSA
jgi:ectoine hydroxylase-related dioxygenase (phytanoyl-CoA dioxygenase family)